MNSAPQSQTAEIIRSKIGTGWRQLRHLPRVWQIVWEAARTWTVFSLIVLAILGLFPIITVYLTRFLVDGAVLAVGNGVSLENAKPVLWPAALMGATFLLIELLSRVSSWLRDHQTERIKDSMVDSIHQVSIRVDLAFYESPEYFDHLHRARSEAFYRPQKLVENAGSLLRSSITLVAMSAVLVQFSLWIPVVLCISTLPALLVVLRHAGIQHRWRQKTTADERRAWYCAHVLTSSENAAELRLFGIGPHYRHRYTNLRKRLRTEWLRLSRDRALAGFGAGLFALLAMAGCVTWMGYRALNGQITLGELALFFAAFRQGQQMMRSLLEEMGDIYRNVLFLGDLFEFLDLKPAVTSPERPEQAPVKLDRGIEFDRVSFSYPGSVRSVLSEFSLSIPAGKVVAIVGPNGSGKSTLLRLICRFYDPTGGRICFDDRDIRSFSVEELQRLITVLFQEPVHYSETVEKNIRLGDLQSEPTTEDIDAAMGAAHAKPVLASLPDGKDTLLGKWFQDGTELSVGEWQRIALARAFLRKASVILLDEPTSAMDSWAEAAWMERLRKLVEGQTALIITHRFTTAMKADIICVMKDGAIVESGSHRDLLDQQGVYAGSWRAQMGESGGSSFK